MPRPEGVRVCSWSGNLSILYTDSFYRLGAQRSIAWINIAITHPRAKAISVEKQTAWFVFSSGLDVTKANENPAPANRFLSGNRLNDRWGPANFIPWRNAR
jgi:hypothetical protein